MAKRILYLFFFSGFSAIIYQIVWQRVLFTSFGTNVESVTIVVSVFMFGLGVGSLLGGYLSKIYNKKLLNLFVFFEFCVGLFGIISVPLIKYVNLLTINLSDWTLPDYPIDNIGVQPDIYLDKSVENWIQFAVNYLEN